MKRIYKIWCGIILAFLVVYLIYEVFISKENDVRMISKAICLIIIYAGAMCGIRFKKSAGISSFKIYEDAYRDIIGEAFQNDKKSYRMLLVSINYYNNKQYQKAINVLSKIESKCESYHDISAVLTFMAFSYEDMGLKNNAIDTYNKLLRTDGSNSLAWSNLGLIYDKMGNNKEALDAYENAIRSNPYNASAYNNISHLYINMNMPEEAFENAMKAVEIDSTMSSAKGNASIALIMLGRFDEARAYYDLYRKDEEDALAFDEMVEKVRSKTVQTFIDIDD